MKPLEKFIQNNRAKSERSKLFPFRAEIFKLAELDYSAKQIAEFVNSKLKKEDKKVAQKTVHNFLKKHQKQKESTSYAKPSKTPVNVSPVSTYNKKQETNTCKAQAPKYVYGVKMDESHPSVKKWKEEEKRRQEND